MCQTTTLYDPFADNKRPPPVHYDSNTNPDRKAWEHVPMCGAKAQDGHGYARYGRYTTDPEGVTCKRCLRSMERRLDEVVTQFARELRRLREEQVKEAKPG